jgi:hypothetical protein
MLRQPYAAILFCLALLMQISSPWARGVERSEAAGVERSLIADCKMMHGDQSGGVPNDGSGRPCHDHCALCQLASSVAPILPATASPGTLLAIVTRIDPPERRERAASLLRTRGPPARAPPALA